MKPTTYRNLSAIQKRLLDAAGEVMETAYNPYSRFYVGAALLTKDGKIISGSNVENAAYGSTICAERLALLRANAEGHRAFRSIAVIGRGKDLDVPDIVSPCGACRQMLFEAAQVSGDELEVIMSNTAKDKVILSSTSELLPLGFGPVNLGIDISDYQK